MRSCGLFSFSTATHCYTGSLWLIFLFNSHSLLYRFIVAYFPLEQSLIVIWGHCGLFSFRTAIHCFMRSCGLFSFSTAIHCYIGSLWLILLFNSHSLLYRIIVAYFPLEQPLIVIWDHCGLFSFRTRHSLLYAKLWLILLFNNHSLLYRIIVAYFRFQHPFIVICELGPYSPFQQPFIVIQDHCGLFSFSTAIHCYIGSLWLIFLQNSHSLLYVKLRLILLFNSHSLLCRIIVAYFRFQQPFIVI